MVSLSSAAIYAHKFLLLDWNELINITQNHLSVKTKSILCLQYKLVGHNRLEIWNVKPG